ncbi:hypothetical protein PU629_20265 [Pullulanibacillus sp. KACC 23026]|uniref:hypothetical protein n=1 Tax=Pullulanibacillus sp. KACC 23026 TaxID=3028315 RepID=UPI0023AE9F10|nr:hypothetical protein [Pullulanibacillus sp. KACC 23026]WEG12404.1 hypothetical protein PU629_20265 [Pullulanibacillus sp. KACC 23026]
MALWFTVVLWVIGIIALFGGKIADNLLRRLERKLERKSEKNKFDDNSAHIAYGAGEKVADAIPWYAVNMFFIIIGLVLIAIGFIPLGFHFI